MRARDGDLKKVYNNILEYMSDLDSSTYKILLKMSRIDPTRESQASSRGSGEKQAQTEKATTISSYKAIKKIFTEEDPLTTGPVDNDLDSVIASAFKEVDFNSFCSADTTTLER